MRIAVGEISLAGIRALHLAVQRRVLRLLWLDATGGEQDFSYKYEEILRELLSGEIYLGERELPQGYRAYTAKDKLKVSKTIKIPPKVTETLEIDLTNSHNDDIIIFQGISLKLNRYEKISADINMRNKRQIYLDLDKTAKVVLRYRSAGDYMELAVGRRKLKDIFIDAKIPREKRDRIPMLACAGSSEIIWIIGDRVNVNYLASADSKNILAWSYVK